MKQPVCPVCSSTRLIKLDDGYYKCQNCGYIGTLTGQGIVRS